MDKTGKQRMDEWTGFDDQALGYHLSQWKTPKRSTVAFGAFAGDAIAGARQIIDLGAGAGASTAFLAAEHPDVSFVAADYVAKFREMGEQLAQQEKIGNLRFKEVDWFNLDQSSEYDGVISLQTLSWLPECERPLEEIFTKLTPNWVGLTSLFHEGDISCTIEVNEHAAGRKSFYNVYSLAEIGRICARHGYRIARQEKFEIDIDIAPPQNRDVMGTFTRKAVSEDGGAAERLQISGPLLMPWYMVMITRG